MSPYVISFFQRSTRRLSLMFVANLALTDTILPFSTSLTTAIIDPKFNSISDHVDRTFSCRLSQAVFTIILLNALLALGEFYSKTISNYFQL